MCYCDFMRSLTIPVKFGKLSVWVNTGPWATHGWKKKKAQILKVRSKCLLESRGMEGLWAHARWGCPAQPLLKCDEVQSCLCWQTSPVSVRNCSGCSQLTSFHKPVKYDLSRADTFGCAKTSKAESLQLARGGLTVSAVLVANSSYNLCQEQGE